MFTRDEIVEAIRTHRPLIVELDEWRPLADHILGLIQLEKEEWEKKLLDK